VHKINTCVIKVSKKELGAKPRSSVHYIQRSNSNITVVMCAGMDRGTGEGMQQNNLQHCTAPYKQKNSKSFSNYIQRSPLHLDWFNTHCDKRGESGQIIQHHEEKSSPRDRLRSTAERLASPSRLRITEQQDEHSIQIFRRQQERARGRNWNSNIHPE
jgi:hypothetical protein